jgi:hypothetical protein
MRDLFEQIVVKLIGLFLILLILVVSLVVIRFFVYFFIIEPLTII